MFGFILKMFIGLLSSCTTRGFGASLASNSKGCSKYVSLHNRTCRATGTLVNINSNETIFYPFIVSVNKCGRSRNIIDDPFA